MKALRPLRKSLLILILTALLLAAPFSTLTGSATDEVQFPPAPRIPEPPLGQVPSVDSLSALTPNPPNQSTYARPADTGWEIYLPFIINDNGVLSVDTQNRQAVVSFYQQYYLGGDSTPSGWNGNVAACNAGTTSAAFKDAVRRRINFFRAMAGAPGNVQFNAVYNQKAQEAALMMNANNTLNHDPPSSWKCYTAAGAEAAGSSNLAWGYNYPNYGVYAIDGYIRDSGAYNQAVGHRRWTLYPWTQTMGTGDVPNPLIYTNALWVFDYDHWGGARPNTRDGFVAWPPPGYVPSPIVYSRWSFSYPGANFGSAAVSMSTGGSGVSLNVVSKTATGYGENTIVWEPSISIPASPHADATYTVNVSNVYIGAVPNNFNYQVILVDPN